MEVALAVITIATAVKDMVELVEKIHESFEKVSDNLRNAQIMASEINQTINELKEFYAQHSVTVEDDKELQKALSDVIDKFTLFESEIVLLIASPSPSSSLLRRVKGGFKAWRNNDQVEARIRQLKKDLKKCQMNFVMISVARMQVKLNELLSAASEGLQLMKQVSDVLVPRTTVSFASYSSSSSSQTSIAARNQSIVAFAQTSSSTSTPRWKTPSSIKEQIIQDTFLKGQINSIADTLSYLLTLDVTYSIQPAKLYQSPFSMSLSNPLLPTYRNPESLHRNVIMQALKLRDTLENLPMSTSIQEGAQDLVNLATGLYHAGMYEEAVTMGEWAVCLFRTLFNAYKAIYSPYLVQSLQNLSLYNNGIGDDNSALKAIEEAVQISEGLQTPSVPVEIRVQYAGVLLIYADIICNIEENRKRAIELAEQSVKLMEDINGIDLRPLAYKNVYYGDRVEVSRSFLMQLYQASPSNMGIATYASALQVLSNCLMADNQQEKALRAKLCALPIYYDLFSLLLVDNVDVELARILGELASQGCRELFPATKVLEYAEDCERIYRRHAELNPSRHGKSLVNALIAKGNALNRLSRKSDALEVWKEIANIAQQMIQDQQCYADALYQVSCGFHLLQEYEEAASSLTLSVLAYEAINNTTTASQAHRYYDLCMNYRLAEMFPEAGEAGKKAVKQYRVLASVEPDKWTHQIGKALVELADALSSAGDHEAALHEGYESMQIFQRLFMTNSECITCYIHSLQVYMKAATTVDNERRAIECMKDILQHMYQLAIDSPGAASRLALLKVELDYGYNLDRLNHIPEARKHLEELIAKWEAEEYQHVDKAIFTSLHSNALGLYASILDNQGDTDLALVHIQRGIDICEPFGDSCPNVAGQTISVMCRHVHLLIKRGWYDKALVVAEAALKFNRETDYMHKTVYTDTYLVGTLHVVGLAARYTRAYERVMEVSQEAVGICKNTHLLKCCDCTECSSLIFSFLRLRLRLSGSLQLLSSGYADSGNLELGLQHGRDAVDNAKTVLANPGSCIERMQAEEYYMEANGHLGAMYLANNRIDEACKTFEETRAYYIERVKLRPGQSGCLISMLHRLGIIYCSAGRHDEGHAVAQEAKECLDHLAEVLPELHKQVHIAMRHESTTPSLQVLNRMKEQLSCTHQTDLSF